LLDSSGSAAPCIRKRYRILLNDGRRNFLDIQSITQIVLNTQTSCGVLMIGLNYFRLKSPHSTGIKHLCTLSGPTAICFKILTFRSCNSSNIIF
jgi:hypothetical protein